MKKYKFLTKIRDFFKYMILIFKNLKPHQKIVSLVLIVILISFIISIFFGKNSIFSYMSVSKEGQKYIGLVEQEKQVNADLKNQINLLKSNSSDLTDEILKTKFNKAPKGVYILKND